MTDKDAPVAPVRYVREAIGEALIECARVFVIRTTLVEPDHVGDRVAPFVGDEL